MEQESWFEQPSFPRQDLPSPWEWPGRAMATPEAQVSGCLCWSAQPWPGDPSLGHALLSLQEIHCVSPLSENDTLLLQPGPSGKSNYLAKRCFPGQDTQPVVSWELSLEQSGFCPLHAAGLICIQASEDCRVNMSRFQSRIPSGGSGRLQEVG